MDMQMPKLGAAVQLWKHLAGIEQALRVEGAFEPLLLVEIGFVEHDRHQVALLSDRRGHPVSNSPSGGSIPPTPASQSVNLR